MRSAVQQQLEAARRDKVIGSVARGEGGAARRRRGAGASSTSTSRELPDAVHREPGGAGDSEPDRAHGAHHRRAPRRGASRRRDPQGGRRQVPALLDLRPGGRGRRRGLSQVPGGPLVTGPGVEQVAAPRALEALARDPALIRKLVVLYVSALALVMVDQWVKYEMVDRLTTRFDGLPSLGAPRRAVRPGAGARVGRAALPPRSGPSC